MITEPTYPTEDLPRLQIDGKFFCSVDHHGKSQRAFLKMVTYGPFPDPQPDHHKELSRIAKAGMNAVRIYTAPSKKFLDAAAAHGLWVFIGIEWAYSYDFIDKPSLLSGAIISLKQTLRDFGKHPALAGVFVANEIPADMVRWMGAVQVKQALEEIIHTGKEICPHLLFAYANFPTTEYLEPNNADFTAMNVYLEVEEDFASYLPRLHNVAGDRPVVISEFGLDTQRNSEQQQAENFLWYVNACLNTGMAGLTIYAWSDRWLNNERVMDDWSFGLTRRDGTEKPSYSALAKVLAEIQTPEHGIVLDKAPFFSVIVCTHNGERHIDACLRSLSELDYPHYEIIVVNDGSTDNTEQIIRRFSNVILHNLQHAGLSAARNHGAAMAKGDILAYTDDDCEPDAGWLKWLAHSFQTHGWDACGGPNLPPMPETRDSLGIDEAVVASAPGAPSHVLLSDQEAEHVPGCNLIVTKKAFNQIGGFNAVYRVAGDDVDFCWRLIHAKLRIGFSGGAFVWHRRRTTLARYFKQQLGYGKAEALLMRDHPHKFKLGSGASWKGQVYEGGSLSVHHGSIIYHGAMGTAPYQQISLNMQPQRPLVREFNNTQARAKLALAKLLQPWLRKYARWRHSLQWRKNLEKNTTLLTPEKPQQETHETRWWSNESILRQTILDTLLQNGWKSLENNTHWDMEQDGAFILIACEYHQSGTTVLVRSNQETALAHVLNMLPT